MASHRVVGALLGVILVFGMMHSLDSASANPGLYNPPHDTTLRLGDPLTAIPGLIIMNFMINSLWLSILILLASWWTSSDLGVSRMTGLRFIGLFLGAVAVITVVGAFVDFYLVTQPPNLSLLPEGSYMWDVWVRSGVSRIIILDSYRWLLAVLLIFLSIAGASRLALGIRLKPSLAIAGLMTYLNPIWWMLAAIFGEDVSAFSILFGLLLAPVAIHALLKWHVNEIRASPSPASG